MKMQWDLFLVIVIAQPCLIVCQLYKYLYINERKNWTEAQQYCREKHTDLAKVTDMTDMKRLLSNSPWNDSEAWIGLYDQTDVNRTWYWSLPGVEYNESESNWNSGEPNDIVGTENCGFIRKEHLKWGDISCNEQLYFLCYNETEKSEKYFLIKQEKTWLEAQRYCREKHTDLISGWIQEEYKIQERLIESVNSAVFIGLFRDTWRWSDGSSFSFRNWNLKFDDEKYNSGKCAMTVFDDEGRWKSDKCNNNKTFICYDDKFILIKENKTWEDALYYCRDHYHDLVTITKHEEQRWIQEKAKKASTKYVWMGLIYACTLDFWFWVSDELVSYKNWASVINTDDCDMSAAMEKGGKHEWVKKNDAEEFNFICSKV